MDSRALTALLRDVQAGTVAPEDAVRLIQAAPFTELGYATLDDQRAIRTGVGEVIYGAGKTPEQICGIVAAMEQNGRKDILITRMSGEAAARLRPDHLAETVRIGEFPRGDARREVDLGIAGDIGPELIPQP